MKFTEEVERLKAAKDDQLILAQNPTLANKHMKVCEICGAMQAINDTETRNQNHLEGKVHTGFALLRKEVEELLKKREMLKLMAKAFRKHGEGGEEFQEKRRSRERGGHRSKRDHGDEERKERKKHRRERSRSGDRDRKKERKHKKEKRHRGSRDRKERRHRDY